MYLARLLVLELALHMHQVSEYPSIHLPALVPSLRTSEQNRGFRPPAPTGFCAKARSEARSWASKKRNAELGAEY